MGEADRAGVIRQVVEKRLKQREAAARLGLSVRQVRRLVGGTEGAEPVVEDEKTVRLRPEREDGTAIAAGVEAGGGSSLAAASQARRAAAG